ncbi:MAG: c-type cytochrome [Epsilonproteobacteria bacterium]|nr:cytochrome C [Campylobacterota bacterium]NPA56775.1 c-type cytochrome [Campylobacterota bacterium]
MASADGATLYAKCSGCHGTKGERKALGKSAPIGGMAKEELLKKLKGYQAGTLNLYGMGGLMKGQVAGLSEGDLEALADYISKLK